MSKLILSTINNVGAGDINSFGINHPYYVYPATVHSMDGLSPREFFVRFPGFGKPKNNSCGAFKCVVACPHAVPENVGCQHYHKVLYFGCYRVECPICYEKACWRDAERITNRILEWARLTGNWMSWKHVIISPPQEWAREMIKTKEGYDKLFEECIKLLKRYGLEAGLVILHHKRKNREEGGKGKFEWRKGVHFHVYGYGYLIKSDEFYEKSGGWIYKNKSRGRRLKGLIFYLLTHRGIGVNGEGKVVKRSTRWFGGLALNKMRTAYVVEEVKTVKCKACGSLAMKYVLEDGKLVEKEIFMCKVKRRVYYLTGQDEWWKADHTLVKCARGIPPPTPGVGGNSAEEIPKVPYRRFREI